MKTLTAIALVLALCSSASAAQRYSAPPPKLKPGPAALPTIMLGAWCSVDEAVGHQEMFQRKDLVGDDPDNCRTTITLTRDGYDSGEESFCRFVSLRRTGGVSPASTQPRREDWIPIMKGIAHCKGEMVDMRVRFTLEYYKAVLYLITDRNKP